MENHWKIHIVENKNGSPCANRGDCVDSCSLTKNVRIDYETLHRSLTSLIKSIDCRHRVERVALTRMFLNLTCDVS